MIKYIKSLLLIIFTSSNFIFNTSTILAAEFAEKIIEGVEKISISVSTPSKVANTGEKLDNEECLSPGAPAPKINTEPAQLIEAIPVPRVGEDAIGSINFYNMGNGNAILVLINGRPPLICDAGSITYKDMFPMIPARQRASVGGSLLIEPMVNDINAFYTNRGVDPARYGQGWPLSICISHPSLDHFNFIHDIITRVRLNDPTPLNIHAVLGGHREDYENAMDHGVPVGNMLLGILAVQRFNFAGEEDDDDPINADDYMRFTAQRAVNNAAEIDWLLHRYDQIRGIEDPNWYGNSHITHLIGQLDLGLNLPVGGNANDHDAKSIVTRIRINSWTVLTQGDALRKNSDLIIGMGVNLESDIYHASLQGGGVNIAPRGYDRANRQNWIRFINPRFGVLTAGLHKGHAHPKADVIQRFFFPNNGNRIDQTQPQHLVHYYNPNNLALPFHPIFGPTRHNGWLGEAYNGNYTTFSSGFIRFMSQNPVQPVTEFVGNNLPPYLP